jgi:hypothetical protein
MWIPHIESDFVTFVFYVLCVCWMRNAGIEIHIEAVVIFIILG